MKILLVLVALCLGLPSARAGDFEVVRGRMVAEIRADAEATSRRIGRRELDPRVLEAMGRVPRHEFVPEALRSRAYENRPLPIGYGQTISQPYIVALMTDLVRVSAGDRVFELGAGSGYQAAVLADLGARVYTVEIVPPLGEQARERLERLGYRDVAVRVGDGYYGWEEHAPFDAIVVTAAASHIPPPLVRQLKPGGRMVIPVGSPFQTQQLTLLEKSEAGAVTTRQLLPVIFVPVTGGH
ncbi:MAG: protein-L-isoaspartate(D-aspartate) O-methyltransferase [Thermodesulfobacteriota bacterium]|jgi:protein-L-isoaspartate(D-aspartate) O-methyltransferase